MSKSRYKVIPLLNVLLALICGGGLLVANLLQFQDQFVYVFICLIVLIQSQMVLYANVRIAELEQKLSSGPSSDSAVSQ